jgi:hypothetical protein
MLGIKSYVLQRNQVENIILTISNALDDSLFFKYNSYGGGYWPSLFCFGYCK